MKYVRDDEIKAAFITLLNKLIYGYRLILTPYLKVLENSSGDGPFIAFSTWNNSSLKTVNNVKP